MFSKTQLNARLAIRQRADFFGANISESGLRFRKVGKGTLPCFFSFRKSYSYVRHLQVMMFLSPSIKTSVLILLTFWGQEMGNGFLDPPLYQAHIQVVPSLNLKLFIKFRVFNWIYTSWVLSDRLTHPYMSIGFLFLIGIMEKENLPSIGKHTCKAKLAQLECCNNTSKAACKSFAWAHIVFYYLSRMC